MPVYWCRKNCFAIKIRFSIKFSFLIKTKKGVKLQKLENFAKKETISTFFSRGINIRVYVLNIYENY